VPGVQVQRQADIAHETDGLKVGGRNPADAGRTGVARNTAPIANGKTWRWHARKRTFASGNSWPTSDGRLSELLAPNGRSDRILNVSKVASISPAGAPATGHHLTDAGDRFRPICRAH